MSDQPTPAEVKAEMRLLALEETVSLFFAAMQVQTPDAVDSLAQLRTQLVENARRRAFRDIDAALSDLASAELETAIDRLLQMQKTYLDQGL